ncbi:MAG: Ig-like domain-containing protein [Anaerolineae bacterium]|jgi:hypothetical protein
MNRILSVNRNAEWHWLAVAVMALVCLLASFVLGVAWPARAASVSWRAGSETAAAGVFEPRLNSPLALRSPPVPAWTRVGEGWAAGDVDGDGYGDFVGYTAPTTVEIYSGTANGLGLLPAQTLINPLLDTFGSQAAPAGDVNNDGYDDVLLKSTGYDSENSLDFVEVGVFHGSSSGLIDVAAVDIQTTWFALLEFYPAGDVNGDHYADILITQVDDDEHIGIHHGSAGTVGAAPATTLSVDGCNPWGGGTIFAGPAGDLNQDGYDDIALALYDCEQVLLFYGSPAGIQTTPAFTLTNSSGSGFGVNVSAAGDVNGDSYDDLVIGADDFIQVVYGDSAGATSLISEVIPSSVFPVQGLGGAFDFNNDGYDDVLVGGDNRAVLFMGSAAGLASQPAFTLTGEMAGDNYGSRVGSAGDVNQDGFGDVYVYADAAESGAGKVYVYHGSELNDPPAFTSAPLTDTSDDVLYLYAVTATDPDAGDSLTFSAPVLPAWLSLADHGGGQATLHGLPGLDDVGDHAVGLRVEDTGGLTDTQTFTLTVTGVNDPPTISAIGDQSTPEGLARGPIPFTIADPETPAGDLLLSAASSNPGLLPPANIVLGGSGTARTVTLTPLPDLDGSATVTLTVSDGSLEAQTAFDLAVSPANDPPTAIFLDNTSVDEGLPAGAVVGTLSAADVDPGDSHTFALVSGTGSQDNGAFAVVGNALQTALPLDREVQALYNIRLRATDGGGRSVEQPFTISVANVNDPPQAVPDLAETEFNTPVTIPVLDNDGDPEGDPLTLLAVYCSLACSGSATVSGNQVIYTPAAGFVGVEPFGYIVHDGNAGLAATTITVLVQPTDTGGVDLQPDVITTTEETAVLIDVLDNDDAAEPLELVFAGPSAGGVASLDGEQVRFEPALDFHGVATFTYAARAGSSGVGSAPVTVHVLPLSDAPTAAADSASTLLGAAVVIDLLANDGDPDGDDIMLAGIGQGVNGLVLRTGPGEVTYYPGTGFHGEDSFSYTIVDGQGGTASGVAHVQVGEVNQPPVGVTDEVYAQEDVPTLIDVLDNDTDPNADDTLQVVAVSQPQHGSARLRANNRVEYVSLANTHGTDNFAYTLRDSGGLTATGLVSVTLEPVLDLPAANPTFGSAPVDGAVSGLDVVGNAANADGLPLYVESYTQPSTGMLSLNPDGAFDYTPPPGFSGQVSFDYTLAVSTAAASLTAAELELIETAGRSSGSVVLQVGPAGGTVVAGNSTAGATGGSSLLLNPLAHAGGGLGDLVLIGMQRRLGQVQAQADGTLTYTPPPDWSGSDTITYTVGDGAGGLATGVIQVGVTVPNRPPDAVQDLVAAVEDTPLVVDVLANDHDYEGGDLDVLAVGPAAYGQAVLEWDGTILYTPPPDFYGIDFFSYLLADEEGATDTTLVSLVVANVNDPPVARDDIASVMEDTRTIIGVLGNDTDADGDVPQVTAGTPQHGTVQVTPVGTLNYLPPPDFYGTDVLTYTLSDGITTTQATAWVTITVNRVNDAPVAVTDTATITAGEPIILRVLDNDTDPDSSQLRLVSAEVPAGDQAAVRGKTVVYTPAEGPGRTATLAYTVADEHGGVSTGTVVVTVIGPPTRIYLPLVFKE